MPSFDRDIATSVTVGVVGLLALLLTALAYSVWDSEQFYDRQQIDQQVETVSISDAP